LWHASSRWVVPVLLALTILLLALAGDDLRQALRYDRQLILAGEWYRLLTGNFVHLGWSHALLNAAGLLLLALMMPGPLPVRSWLARLLVLSGGVGLGLFFLSPGLQWYVGLSGVLHGLFVLVLIPMATGGEAVAVMVLALLIGKAAWEHYHGPLQVSLAVLEAPVVTAAHSYGIATAVAYHLFIVMTKQQRRSRQTGSGNTD
jgi:rhomboid family GlyGly-CTERM serine protease